MQLAFKYHFFRGQNTSVDVFFFQNQITTEVKKKFVLDYLQFSSFQ